MNSDGNRGAGARIAAGGKPIRALFTPMRVLGAALVFLGLFAPYSASAQEFPFKPVRLVVSSAAGSFADSIARIVSPEMGNALGQPIIIENRPGASAIVGIQYVLSQPADGYTVALIALDSLASLPVTTKSLPFDPLKDIPPFSAVAEARWVLGSSSKMPWKSFRELLDKVKENPTSFNYGSPSVMMTLLTESILRDRGLVATSIPYTSGGANFYQALVNGDLQFSLFAESTATTARDKLNLFAVTGQTRSATFPDVPTFAELGYPKVPGILYALHARAGTPRPALDKLGGATAQAVRKPETKAQLGKLLLEVPEQGAQAAMQGFAERTRFFSEIARQIKFQPE